MKLGKSFFSDKCSYRPLNQVLFLIGLLVLGINVDVASGQMVEPFGPGVAGQVYSLAYDPDNSNIIYAGGDMHGVFKTENGGENWVVINNGLQNDDCNESFYIMDLIVLGNFHQVPESRKGVYAATAGGVFFREKNSSVWILQTDYNQNPKYEYFGGDAVGTQGNGIPFSSFAFCQETGILYAGTGSTRLLYNACDTYEVYPQHDDPPSGYSIWTLNVLDDESNWDYDVASVGLALVKQVAIVVRDAGVLDDVVFASCGGIYKKNHFTNQWEEIFNSGNKSLPALASSWSDYPTGVSGGSDNYLYCISKNSTETIGGVFKLDLGDQGASWQLLGGEQLSDDIYPHTGFTVQEFFEDETRLLGTLTVIPGEIHSDDQVFVGVRAGQEDGYFRFGPNSNPTSPSWVHFLLRTSAGADRVEYQFVDYSEDPIQSPQAITPSGWLENSSIHSTTPLAFYPQNTEYMFAMNYHLPVGTENGGELWQQWNCDGSYSGGWESRGINLMHTYDFEFSPDEKMWIGSRDFGLFQEATGNSKHFLWRDRTSTGAKRAMALQGVSGQVYVLRMGARRGWNNDSTTFGFRHYVVSHGDEYSWEPNAETAVAYSDPLIEDTMDGDDGYGWRFITRGLDDVFTGSGDNYHYRINGFQMAGVDTCYVACMEQNATPTYIYRGILNGENEIWSLVSTIPGLWSAAGRTFIKKIPASNFILVGAGGYRQGNNNNNTCGLYCIDTRLENGDPVPWVTSANFQGSLIDFSCRVSSVEISHEGGYLYVGTHGNYEVPGDVEIGSLIRLPAPKGFVNSPPLAGDWEVLANFGSENTFFSGHGEPHFWYTEYNDGATEAGHRLTHIEGISIDPKNAKVVYVALGGPYIPYLHPRFGAWKMDHLGVWTQLTGSSEGAPYKGATAIEINPFNNSELLLGTQGAECFSVGITPSVCPEISTTAEHLLLVGSGTTTSFAVEVTHPEGMEITTVILDATSIDLGNNIPLTDGDEDGIFTSAELSISEATGLAEVSVFAQASDSGYVWENVQVFLFEDRFAHFSDKSDTTGDLSDLGGLPWASVTLNAGDALNTSPGFGEEDIFVTVQGANDGKLFEFFSLVGSGIPSFDKDTDALFKPGDIPGNNYRGIAVADFDNDGFEDILLTHFEQGKTCLYRWNPAGNDSTGYFEDAVDEGYVTIEGGLPGANYSVAWGDYNQDGYVDLFFARFPTDLDDVISELGSPATVSVAAYLYQSSPRNGGIHFAPVGADVLPSVTQNSAIVAVNWIDIDSDGDLDIFYGSFYSSGPKVLINSGYPDYIYSDQTVSWIPEGQLNNTWCSSFADLNNNGLPDLISGASVDVNRLRIHENLGSGQGFVLAESNHQVSTPVTVTTGDIDLNGFVDVVAVPYAGGIPPSLLLNGLLGEGMVFNNHPGAINMEERSRTALTVHDWGEDGDLDIYMGHEPEASGEDDRFFYLNGRADGNSSPSRDKIVKICIGGGSSGAVGAKVSVQASPAGPARTAYARTSDGRGSQTSRILVFGVPDSDSRFATATITWPDSSVSHHDSLTTDGTLNFISQNMPILEILGPITAARNVGPDGSELEFICFARKPLADFQVELDLTGGPIQCECGHSEDSLVLSDSYPGVVVQVTRVGRHLYQHKLVLTDWCCYLNCEYPYNISGKYGIEECTSGEQTLYTNTCGKKIIIHED